MEIGIKIKKIRKEKKIPQAKLAQQIGLSNSYLCDIEAGRKRVNVDTLIKIADALDVRDFNVLLSKQQNER